MKGGDFRYTSPVSAFLTIAVIHFLAVVSPGPDFAIVTRNSLSYSRRDGVATAAGCGLGILVHVSYSLLGIGFLISRSILLFTIIKYIGAAYLIYIGWKALVSKSEEVSALCARKLRPITLRQAFCNGFLTNVLNPKATLFMLALFTQVIEPSTPVAVQAFYGIYMGVATFVWFSFVASVFSLRAIRQCLGGIQSGIERAMGAVLIALGLKVALSAQE
ncbi:MAG: Lysine exporter protein LysE/YggA [Candidatus Peribacteria bacterium GW2011_GWC2_54_8]|nr:MAG: Lysine exporter protein LysE/YggA [Candidatus Peribacteria bacterium GW2011_GWC2_54_8]KKW41903.1 MAG: Lysine exporter protein LysE/YggA [Candidatus Peregrinibacteria bacterium GW2011_GWA2_54_9]